MLKHHLFIFFRFLKKGKSAAFVNIIGLTLAFTAFFVLTCYSVYESSYDQHFSDHQHIYRLTTKQVVENVVKAQDAMSFYPAGKALVSDLPEAIAYTTLFKPGGLGIRGKEKEWRNELRTFAVDANFFKIFQYAVIEGDINRMREPYQLVLTRSKAVEYFGTEQVVNKTLFVGNTFGRPFQIAAVVEDFPQNTHLKWDVLFSLASRESEAEADGWNNYTYYTYLKFDKKVEPGYYQEKLSQLAAKYLGQETSLQFDLQPLADIHLNAEYIYEVEPPGNLYAIRMVEITAWIIILFAWVNYTNLSLAQLFRRGKEVGLRKVLGSTKKQLVMQLVFEAVGLSFISFSLAATVFSVVSVAYADWIGMSPLDFLEDHPRFLLYFSLLIIAGAIISAVYPSLLVIRTKVSDALSSRHLTGSEGTSIREKLLFFQFLASMVMLSGSAIVWQQVNHMRNGDKGMDIGQVVGVSLPALPAKSWDEALKQIRILSVGLNQHPQIYSTAVISNMPGGGSSDVNTSGGARIKGLSDYNPQAVYSIGMDENVIPLLGIELIFGRNFMGSRSGDRRSVIVNESFLQHQGVPLSADIIGKQVVFGRSGDDTPYEIIGIIGDFQRTSAKVAIEPTVYFCDWGYGGGYGFSNLLMKLHGPELKPALIHIERVWKESFPQDVLAYGFLDDRYEALYEGETRFGEISAVFSALAILVSVLGLFSLVSFMLTQRTLEVSMRKVLGASAKDILVLFSREISRMLVIAGLVAAPVIYYSLNSWLEQFAVRIDFPWLIVFVSVFSVSLLTLGITTLQLLRVAFSNPVVGLSQT